MASKNELAVPTFLRQWRDFRRMTQEQLAARTDLTPPSISQLETGAQGFTDKSLARLAEALQCRPVDILAFDPSRPDNFWPLFQAAERLDGRSRKHVYGVMAALLNGAGE